MTASLSLTAFDHQIAELQNRIGALRLRAGDHPSDILTEALVQLELGLDALRTAQQDLHRQAGAAADSEAVTLRARRRYIDLFNQAPDSYIVTDTRGLILEVNQATAQLLQRPVRFLVRKPIFVFFGIEAARRMRLHVQHLVLGEVDDPLTFDETLNLVGQAISIEAEFVVSRGFDVLNGQLVQLRWRLHDIGARKVAEREMLASRQVLRDLAARLESVREDERARIAREVHDELGGSLTALKMEAVQTRHKIDAGDAQAARQHTAVISHMADSLIGQVRHIASDLRPAVLDVLGLPAAVSWQLSEFETHTGVAVKLEMPEDLACPPELAIVCFRILQELLTNVTRHAEAACVQVRLEQADDKLFMEVRDDGTGIQAADISRSTSLGLLGIRERVEQFGGVFQVRPVQPHGTVARVEMPLESN